MEKFTSSLGAKIQESAENGAIRIHEAYVGDTIVEISYFDINENLLDTEVYKMVDVFEEGWEIDEESADSEGVILIEVQKRFASSLIGFLTDLLKNDNRELSKITIDVGDKMSDGSWDNFYIHFPSE